MIAELAIRRIASRLGSTVVAALLAASPHHAHAGAADGTYKITRITNQFEADGEPYKIPVKDLKESFFNMDGIVIKNNRLPVYQSKWFKELRKPELRDAFSTLELKGPRKIRLNRIKQGTFRGMADEPLVANFSISFIEDVKIPIRMQTRARGKIVGDELVMDMTVRIIVRDKSPAKEHYIIKGNILVTAQKTEFPSN